MTEQSQELVAEGRAEHRDGSDHVGAVRVARTLAYMYGSVFGDWAVMSGWLARAQTLVGDAMESREGGWVTLARSPGRLFPMLVVGWPFAESMAYKADIEANYLMTLELAPEFCRAGQKRNTRGAVLRRIRTQLLPQAVRPGLGAGR